MDAATLATLLAGLLLGLLLGAGLGFLLGTGRPRADDGSEARLAHALETRSAEAAVLKESLERLHDQMRDLEHQRATWQGQLHQQVADMRITTESLGRETRSLSASLRRPQVRGRWGELHLRRTVELAGMVEHCDFSEQVHLSSPGEAARRPDLVVHLAGGRQVVVDAKVPLDAFLDAAGSAEVDEGRSDDERGRLLARHARALRGHVDHLGSKSYWRALAETPEFVVCFLPADAVLAAALEADPGLLEHAASRRVVLASPTTLIALLRTVAHGWSHEALTQRAREVLELGRELHRRLGTLGGHLDQLGRSLGTAVGHYNAAVGSWEARVLVQARRFADLGVTDEELYPPRGVGLHAVPPGDRSPVSASTEPRRGGEEARAPDRTVGA